MKNNLYYHNQLVMLVNALIFSRPKPLMSQRSQFLHRTHIFFPHFSVLRGYFPFLNSESPTERPRKPLCKFCIEISRIAVARNRFRLEQLRADIINVYCIFPHVMEFRSPRTGWVDIVIPRDDGGNPCHCHIHGAMAAGCSGRRAVVVDGSVFLQTLHSGENAGSWNGA